MATPPPQRMLPQKRPLPEPQPRLPRVTVNEEEKKIYLLIKSHKSMGIAQPDIRTAAGIDTRALGKILKSLETKKLIKQVTSARRNHAKIYMDFNCQPSAEISGGHWFVDGRFDSELVAAIRSACIGIIKGLKIVTVDDMLRAINANSIVKGGAVMEQIEETIQSLKVDGVVEEVMSTGVGEFARVPVGKYCYRIPAEKSKPVTGLMASIPCAVCPRISECTPDGIISPDTCVYYQKWLGLDF